MGRGWGARIARRDFRVWRCGGGVGRGVRRGCARFAEIVERVRSGGLLWCKGGIGKGMGHAHTVVPIVFQTIKFLSIIDELGAKVLDPFAGFFLFGWDQLFLRHFGVIVYRP